MRPVFRVVLVLLLAFFMYRPLLRLQQTTRHFFTPLAITTTTTTTHTPSNARSQSDMSRPNGTIATKGLELLTFGTPNGLSLTLTSPRHCH